jgi:hypothetical protein
MATEAIVGWQRRRANAKPSLISKFRFVIGKEIQIHFSVKICYKEVRP